MALVQKHLLKRQRLGEMTSTLSLNYKNYLHFSFYIFKHLILCWRSGRRMLHEAVHRPFPSAKV